jgi:hypothetical protein
MRKGLDCLCISPLSHPTSVQPDSLAIPVARRLDACSAKLHRSCVTTCDPVLGARRSPLCSGLRLQGTDTGSLPRLGQKSPRGAPCMSGWDSGAPAGRHADLQPETTGGRHERERENEPEDRRLSSQRGDLGFCLRIRRPRLDIESRRVLAGHVLHQTPEARKNMVNDRRRNSGPVR